MIAAQFYQLKSGQALTAHMKKLKKQEDGQCGWCLDSVALIQALLHMAIPAKRDVGKGWLAAAKYGNILLLRCP